MRYAVASILLVLGIVVGALGVAQKTVWAPSERIEAQAELSDPGPVVVIEPGVMNLYPGQSVLTVEGEGDVTVAQASKENVDAWVGEAAHTTITGLSSETELRTEKADGEAETPNPAEADLWTAAQTDAGSTELTWDQEAGRTALLIGTDGQSPAAQRVTISWLNTATTPWAIPLMIIGGLLILGGIISGVLAYRKAQREQERRKKREERRRKLAEVGAAFVIVPGLALAGCAPTELPEPQAAEAPESPAGVITDEQLASILEKTRAAVEDADKNTDDKKLAGRAAGPFLDQRKGAYAVKKKDKDFDLPPAVATQNVAVNFTSATDQWPRVTAAVTTNEEQNQTQLLVLSQEDPRADWKLWSQTVLLAGAEFPSVNDAREGSELLAADANGFVLSPEQTVKQYPDVLQHGGDSKFAKNFTDDAFRKQTAQDQKKAEEGVKDGNASVDFKYAAGGADRIVAQRAGDGGALVVGTADLTVSYAPESVDGRTGELSIPKPQSKVVGETKTKKKLESTYTQVYAFIVPNEGEEQARLIGVTSVLTGAKLS